MRSELITLLRSDLIAAGYLLPEIRSILGAEADAARERGVFAPAQRILYGLEHSPLQILVRSFMLGDTLTTEELSVAFPELRAAGAIELGLFHAVPQSEESSDLWQVALSLNAVEINDSASETPLHWWLISDLDDHLRKGPAQPHHVMGVGGATRSLILQAPPGAAARTLDLGTGCGVVALHLALRGEVVATDISERALKFARANAQLNSVTGIDFRLGNLFEPVALETFDLILSNPPFVVTPRSVSTTYEYRDAGMVGDALAARVVEEAPSYLVPGGLLLCLANWESPWGIDGSLRVAEWVDRAAARAELPAENLVSWVIERDRVSPIRYAETWARDGGARPGENEFDDLLRQWIDDFADRQIVSVGLGSIRVLRLAERTSPDLPHAIRHVERAAGPFSAKPGGALDSAFRAGIAAEMMKHDQILDRYWFRVPGVSETRVHQPGIEAPQEIFLTVPHGIERQVIADPLLAAAIGACDGDLTLRQISDALATILEVDAAAAAEALIAGARELAWMGMLTPDAASAQ